MPYLLERARDQSHPASRGRTGRAAQKWDRRVGLGAGGFAYPWGGRRLMEPRIWSQKGLIPKWAYRVWLPRIHLLRGAGVPSPSPSSSSPMRCHWDWRGESQAKGMKQELPGCGS